VLFVEWQVAFPTPVPWINPTCSPNYSPCIHQLSLLRLVCASYPSIHYSLFTLARNSRSAHDLSSRNALWRHGTCKLIIDRQPYLTHLNYCVLGTGGLTWCDLKSTVCSQVIRKLFIDVNKRLIHWLINSNVIKTSLLVSTDVAVYQSDIIIQKMILVLIWHTRWSDLKASIKLWLIRCYDVNRMLIILMCLISLSTHPLGRYLVHKCRHSCIVFRSHCARAALYSRRHFDAWLHDFKSENR